MNRVLTSSLRGNWSQYLLPAAVLIGPCSYMAYHDFMLPKTKKFHSIKQGDNEKQLNARVVELTIEAILDTKDEISVIQGVKDQGKPNPLAFFYSLSPFYAGKSGSSHGSLIGLPLYVDYEVASDIPKDHLNIRVLPSFMITQEAVVKVDEVNLDKYLEKLSALSNDLHKSFQVDTETEDGQNYVNSLLLSEKAKKFLIARQIFYTDTNQVMINYCLFALGGLIPMTLVKLLTALKVRRVLRIPLQSIILTLGLVQCVIVKDIVQNYYDEKSDRLAGGLSQDYIEGGIEYYSKCIQRNLAIRKMDRISARYIDAKGNIRNHLSMLTFREMPLTERLQQLIKLKS